jgi:competence protein ComEA
MAKVLTPRDILALAGAALAIVALGAAAWLSFGPRGVAEAGGALPAASGPVGGIVASTEPTPSGGIDELLVDVQGAVARPGLVRLPAGSRVADAIAAAGGYTKRTDLLAAATGINLAAPLADGLQVFVPIVGVAVGGTGSGGAGGGFGGAGGDALVNLNTATPEELEALPGIGPVTVQKIVAARQERPFATLDELVEREVMNRGQLDDIRDLVTL